jgi:hypothetical protein
VIDNRTIQTFLKTGGFYTGLLDGIVGPATVSAERAALRKANVNAGTWTNDRVTIAINQLFLNEANDAGLIVDGVMGERTNDALYIFSTTLLHTISTNWPRQADVRAGTSMFGRPGHNQSEVILPYMMFGDYQRKIKVPKFQCHERVVDSLGRIFQRILDQYGLAKIRKLNLDIFSGCYNYRQTTGSSSLSMHAWGIGIDIDAAHNQMDEGASQAAFSKSEYAPMISFFEAEGWVSLGHARNFDWMHFQAARL